MKLNRSARKMIGLAAPVEGWWYENAKSIDVYLRDRVVGTTLKGRIRRADLADWLKRTKV